MKKKALFWIGSTRRDLKTFPREVQREMGFALYRSQLGGKHIHAKPLKGFGGAGVVEAIKDFRGDTYRTVYTVRFADAIYAVHAFQKKSKRGRKTSSRDIDLVRQRLREAKEHHDSWQRDS